MLGLVGAGWFAVTVVFKAQGPEEAGMLQVPALAYEASTAERHGAGEVSLGEQILESRSASVRAPGKEEAIGMPLPEEPLEGQRRAPRCEPPVEITINGGCWIQVAGVKPPCGKRAYEWKGACYMPSVPPEREPTSDKP